MVKAAIIPAILYFGACFWQVHLEAGKAGLGGKSARRSCRAPTAIKEHWPLVLPLAGARLPALCRLHADLRRHDGPGATVVLILGTPLAALIGPFAFRVVFCIALGLAAAACMRFGVNVLAAVMAALGLACLAFRGGRETLRICLDSLAEGAKNALPVGIACAIVGIVIGTLTLTGIASTLIGAIIAIGQNNLFLSLILTMLTCLVLGMGIPTIPNYIITSSLAGPALLELGVPLLVSHMFVFYFGIMADLTPPVALAAFAAAPMAKESGLKIGVQASKLAIAGFVVPFMAVYTPALMLQDPGPIAQSFGYPVEAVYIVAKAVSASRCGRGGGRLPFHPPRRLDGSSPLPPAFSWCLPCRSPTRSAGRSPRRGSHGTGGGRGRPRCNEPLHPHRRQDDGAAVSAFTLSSSHSIEKTRWEEDWRRPRPASKSSRRGSRGRAPGWSRRRAQS